MDNELQSESPDSAQKKSSFDAYKSVFKSINKTGQPGLHEAAAKDAAPKEAAQQEAAPKEAAAPETGRPDISKSRENQLPLSMKGAPLPEEKKQPQLTLTKEKEAGEMLQPEKLHELKEERETLAGKKPAAEHQVVQSSEFFKASAKKESEKAQPETTGKADEETASPKEKTVEQKAPLREKSFIAAARDRKSPSDETLSTMRGDGPAGQSMPQLSERATLMTSWTSGMAAQEEVRSSSHRSGSTKDKDKFSSAGDRQTIDAVERRDRDFNQSKSDQDSSQDGSSQERAKAGITRKQQGPLSGTPSQDQPSKAPEQQPHDYFRKETTKQQLDERIKVFQASKEQPLKHTMQAAQHATTSIESILKKSQKETWTGDEMAAKLIALLMKSSSEYTYDHSTRVIDLSVMLAKEMGINDEQSLKDIEEGAMFHDIGEVELDLEKAPQGVKKRLSNYIGIADLKNCSFLHDIGKIKIPEEILYKPSRLTSEEYEVLKQHPIIGEQILKPIPSLQHVVPVVRHHHERWDGKGYPDGLQGAETPQSARIISITDAFDAMISDRPYRKGMPVQEAMKEIKKGAGTQFDPTLVEAFLKVVEKQYL
ncbi:MAG: HD domain-containing phosphohydrolase [Candidatus Xenobiia bacterium LiM19]